MYHRISQNEIDFCKYLMVSQMNYYKRLEKNNEPLTKCKRNCGFCAKLKVSIFVQSLVIN